MDKTRQSANLVSENNIFSDITNSRVGIGTTIPVGQLQVSGGPVIIGSATSTGTASQSLQVTGGAYVSGSVGIGSTNPQESLDVVGGNGFVRIGQVFTGYNGITLNNSTTDANYNILSSPQDTGLYINRPTGASIRFRMNNVDQMILTSAGNLGIGTTNPQGTLQVGTAITMYASTGIISATSYCGDGSQLTNVGTDITSSLFT